MPLAVSLSVHGKPHDPCTPSSWSDCHNHRSRAEELAGAAIDFCSVSIVALTQRQPTTSPQRVNSVAPLGRVVKDLAGNFDFLSFATFYLLPRLPAPNALSLDD